MLSAARASLRMPSVVSRTLHSTTFLSASPQEKFDAAKASLDKLGPDDEPSNDVKLKMYALFKQATVGPCNIKKPGMMDFVGKAKWDAWNSLGPLAKEEAMSQYADVVTELTKNSSVAGGQESAGTQATGQDAPVVIQQDGGVLRIRLNRPKKYNALTRDMYRVITDALNNANSNKSIKVTVITGTGDYYCSGNDLSMFAGVDPSNVGEMAENGRVLLKDFVGSFIDHKKPLVGLINGPAVGISVTVLGLFDAVYAVDSATFQTPFPQVGQTPEGCSSYVFPMLMGNSKASEVLLGRKLSAQEACERNLVTRVFPKSTFEQETSAMVKTFESLPPESVQCGKGLMRFNCKDMLHKVNVEECRVLAERWQSVECAEAVMKFFTRKSKA